MEQIGRLKFESDTLLNFYALSWLEHNIIKAKIMNWISI